MKIIFRHSLMWFAALLIVLVSSLSSNARSFNKRVDADLDLDGKRELIVLNSELDTALQIRRRDQVLWSGVPGAWRPWKLEIADVDGDGKREIIVGVFKSTKFFQKPHNCLFIYGWSGKRAFPKWLGSSLGRPFTDFLFADLDGLAGDELAALETTLDGNQSLAVYNWNGFGFTLERQQGEWRSATGMSADKGQISLLADGERIYLSNEKTRKKL